MPKRKEIKKVLVIGSGPIVIGQAAEFDYAGTQACQALKEEGCEVVLVNNNPATIMTDDEFADIVYFEPLTVEKVKAVIEKERPDGLLATLGGQTGLNLAFSLHRQGILEQYNLTMLGTPMESIRRGEDRDAFRSLMYELNEPVADSEIVESLEGAYSFAEAVGYPLIVRPAYTLGGSGGGIATEKGELESHVKRGLKASPIQQVLLEKSIAGFKEIEYEVIRDAEGTCIIVCDMENVDPVGIHTGDSIVVAPSQTLSDCDQQMLQQVAIEIVQALGIIGGCNIQFALDPNSKQYYVIEVNPRVSRSSALASKATGFPIAKIATKLSLGYRLHELDNSVTGDTLASYEPAMDYIVVKFPRWPFDKFIDADRKLGTQMKATGEVMAVGHNLESAFQKAVRSLEIETDGLLLPELASFTTAVLWQLAKEADDRRFFVLLELLRRGEAPSALYEKTGINRFFLDRLLRLITLENEVKSSCFSTLTKEQLLTYKQSGFSDEWLAKEWEISTRTLREKRKQWHVLPSYKMVAAYSATDGAMSGFYYSTWSGQDNHTTTAKQKILVVGSGPIRIGQGIEFDYCSVHGVLALEKYGYETVLMNNNPETVSTDNEMADRLYFEPLTVEDVLNVVDFENIAGVIVQFGGQTAISLVKGLEEAGAPILGSSQEVIDELEDRDRFYQLLQTIGLPHIPGLTAVNKRDLQEKIAEIGFPVLLRPSYVIGGKGMVILESEERLASYLNELNALHHFPILIDAYYPGKEIEIDVVTDGEEIVIPGIFEHVEKAGVHSGDSFAVTPTFSISEDMKKRVAAYAQKIAESIDFKGIFNIQFVIHNGELYVLEVNPRASRTVPLLSKATGVNMIELATAELLGKSLQTLPTKLGLYPETGYYAMKAPVFSTAKLPGVDPKLAPEMKSTGELMVIAKTLSEGFSEAFLCSEQLATSFVKYASEMYVDANVGELEQFADLLAKLSRLGVNLVSEQSSDLVKKVSSFQDWLKSAHSFALISFTSNHDKRTQAVQYGLPVLSAVETVDAFASMATEMSHVCSLQQWQKTDRKAVVVQ